MIRVTDCKYFGNYNNYTFEADEEADLTKMPVNKDGRCDYGSKIGTGSSFTYLKADGNISVYKFSEATNKWIKMM